MRKLLKTEEFEQCGYSYIREIYDNGTVVEFIKPQPIEYIDAIEQPTPEPHQPTNAEVAQMISDLQVDLIIAGVI